MSKPQVENIEFRVSATQLARCFGENLQTINKHVTEGMPRREDSAYDLNACWTWRYDQKGVDGASEKIDLWTEKARLTRAQAEAKEMEVAAGKGQLLPVEDVRASWEDLVLSLKKKILVLPTKLPSRLIACADQNEIKEILDTEIYDALSELARMGVSAHDSPAKVDSKRMGGRKKKVKLGSVSRTGTMENGEGGVST